MERARSFAASVAPVALLAVRLVLSVTASVTSPRSHWKHDGFGPKTCEPSLLAERR